MNQSNIPVPTHCNVCDQGHTPLKSTNMNKEQLLQPRYKVIADYPGSRLKIGSIIKLDTTYGASAATIISAYAGNEERHYWPTHEFDKYPAIFQRLEWWEERQKEDLPEYIFWPKSEIGLVQKGTWKSNKFGLEFHLENGNYTLHFIHALPATESEFLAYQSQLPPPNARGKQGENCNYGKPNEGKLLERIA